MTNQVNPYAPPKAKVDGVPESYTGSGAPFYAVALPKFYLLFLLTGGVYAVYWMYRNFKAQQQNTVGDEDIWPVARAIFMIFFIHNLMGRVQRRLTSLGTTGYGGLSGLATALVIVWLLPSIAGQLVGRGAAPQWLMWSGFAMIPVICFLLGRCQSAINAACTDPDGSSNSTVTAANIVWIVIGVIYNAFIVMTTMTALQMLAQQQR